MEDHNPHLSSNPLQCPPPVTPLHQLSPERMNQQRIPQSPSLHSYLVDHDRPRTRDSITSDVQTKVAFLNSLANGSTQSSPTRPRRAAAPSENGLSPIKSDANGSNAAFQRAIMGYEEAQASLATLSAELERAKEELASRKKRERVLSQRVEDLLEELQADKEKRVRDQESYTKEIKRCRKETYRAELAVVEARQDLQETRAELKKCQAEVQHERSEKEKSRQESFERAYALAGTVGELEQVKDRLKVVERERDAVLVEAKQNAIEKSTAVERGMQTVPVAETDPKQNEAEDDRSESVMAVREAIKSQWAHHAHSVSDNRPVSSQSTASGSRITTERPPRLRAPKVPDFSSVISHLNYFSKQSEGDKMAPEEEIQFLKQELTWAKRKHTEDADLIHLMHMQCQFKSCPCRLAESNGERFVHDAVYDAKMQQQQVSKKRKISKEEDEVVLKKSASKDIPKAQSLASKMPETARLPPEPTPELANRTLESPLVLEQAMEVPLPEPEPMELDSSNITPEPTAQLEEITQVLVEPATGSKPFAFSTSTTSNADLRAMAPPLRHTESASAALEADLFDLSPPKQLPPRRPSTAMGILSANSPIRLVPESPRSARSSRDSIRSAARGRTQATPKPSSTTTVTKVALKDSPPRTSLHRRAQSKPNLRSHSPLVTSTVMSHHNESDTQSAFVKDTSASPAASTVFPMTPVHKHSRSMHTLAQVQPTGTECEPTSPPEAIATTTTTRVPLRGDPEADDVFEPDHRPQSTLHEHAQTEVLNICTDNIPSSTITYPQSASRPTFVASSSQAMLTNVPGTPISREVALAQIRARRDRARSVNLKRSLESGAVGKENTGGRSPTKGRPVVINGMGKENAGLGGVRTVREISQASAPGRFAF
ncbi:hypothetical protein G647_06623 [Cladophialophora carrionii CBS 160.54]|uniref:DNA endonuclease activator Ctp1 C-terminal domain-containing protein n=1 Tax=Cladophialophora carrionii CBS 160.54 TaxID=1279043 RepID=V9D997_9EURO|nr:uncharacterized protein G647_06623 [Cladophialophora carrionii CBS 160.54]ETI22547.1 hypothetical protein G647_06623 [Cladophialophora carrionii CBS 160.54]